MLCHAFIADINQRPIPPFRGIGLISNLDWFSLWVLEVRDIFSICIGGCIGGKKCHA